MFSHDDSGLLLLFLYRGTGWPTREASSGILCSNLWFFCLHRKDLFDVNASCDLIPRKCQRGNMNSADFNSLDPVKVVISGWMFSVCLQDFGLGVSSSPRCDLKHNLVAAGCAPSAVESPTSKLQVVEDRPLSNKATVATQDITQIKPQRLHINLRPGGLAHLWVGVWV